MKLALVLFILSGSNAFASDAVVEERFQKVVIHSIVGASIADQIVASDGRHAVIRVSVDLRVEGNLGSCQFDRFASALDYHWYETARPMYLSVITTACPQPKPLDLMGEGGSFAVAEPRAITTTYDLDLYDGMSQTVTVLTGTQEDEKEEIVVSFSGRKPTLQVKR